MLVHVSSCCDGAVQVAAVEAAHCVLSAQLWLARVMLTTCRRGAPCKWCCLAFTTLSFYCFACSGFGPATKLYCITPLRLLGSVIPSVYIGRLVVCHRCVYHGVLATDTHKHKLMMCSR